MASLLKRCADAYADSDASAFAYHDGLVAVINYLAQELHRQGYWQAAVFLADYEAQLEDENTTGTDSDD